MKLRDSSKFRITFVLVSITAVGLIQSAVTPALAGSGGFNSTGSMNVARVNHTATLLANGEVLVAGGNNNSTGYLSGAEVYNCPYRKLRPVQLATHRVNRSILALC